MRNTIILLVSLVLLLGACNVFIEKRRYKKGFHVQWNNKKRVTKSEEKAEIRYAKSNSADHELDHVKVEPSSNQSTVASINEKNEDNNTVHFENKVAENSSTIESQFVEKEESMSVAEHGEISEEFNAVFQSKQINTTKDRNGDGWLFGLLGGMLAFSYGLIRILRKRAMRISRWANRNGKLTRGAIFAGHVGVGALGFYVGKSLGQFGGELSLSSQYAVGGVFFLSSGFLYHLEKRGVGFATWKSFFKHRLGHLIAGVSLFGLMMGVGNSIHYDNKQISIVGNAISYFASDNDSSGEQQIQNNEEEAREKASAGAVFAAVLLAILILGITAVGACAAACNDQGFLAVAIVIVGIAITVLVIRAITRTS